MRLKKRNSTTSKKPKSSKTFNTKNFFPKLKKSSGNSVVVKTTRLHNSTEHVTVGSPVFLLNRMERLNGSGYYRQNMFGAEIIWNTNRYSFVNPDVKETEQSKRKHLFIFGLVKRDAEKFCKKNKVEPTDWLPSIEYNHLFKKTSQKIVGVDIDAAYWRIAFQMGIISENTYKHGIRIDNKGICVAALANLGADKNYNVIENGCISPRTVLVKGSDKLKEAYRMIRFTCFNYMQELAVMLGDQFINYRTDCIYFVNNDVNMQIVETFMQERQLDYKISKGMSKLTKKA